MQNTWRWIRSHWPLLATILLFPFIGPFALIILGFGHIKGAARAVLRFIGGAWGSIGHILAAPFIFAWGIIGSILRTIVKFLEKIASLASAVTSLPGKVGGFLSSLSPFAEGGVINRPGFQVVGERGPELAAFPVGTRIHTASETKKILTPKATKMKLPGKVAAAAAGARETIRQPIVLMLDGRVLAETTVTVQENAEARA